MTAPINRELSDRLRATLGVTEESGARVAIATAAEIRALRAMLRLDRTQFARRYRTAPNNVSYWERGESQVAPKGETAERLARDLDVARKLGALAFDPRPNAKDEPRRRQRTAPRLPGNPPPAQYEYACVGCGRRTDISGDRRRRLRRERCWVEVNDQGREVIWHRQGGERCGEVQPGGPVRRAEVLATREPELAP